MCFDTVNQLCTTTLNSAMLIFRQCYLTISSKYALRKKYILVTQLWVSMVGVKMGEYGWGKIAVGSVRSLILPHLHD